MAGRKRGKHTQAARVLRLLDRLAGRRHGVALSVLADELEVTERQVRRDVEALIDAGHDVVVGPRDGRATVRLVSASTRAVVVTRRERYTLLGVLRVFDVLRGTPFFDDVESLFEKLTETMSADERAELARFGERFAYVPDGGRKPYDGKDDVANALQTGVLDRRLVQYTYRAPTGKRHGGTLAPYALALYRNGLYVVGQRVATGAAAGAPLPSTRPFVYAVERFVEATVLRKTRFEVPPGVRLAELFEGAFGIFFNGEPTRVVIDFSAELAEWVQARVWHRTQQVAARREGGVRLEMDVVNTTEVVPWVMSFGPHARVVAPEALATRVRDEHLAAVDAGGGRRRRRPTRASAGSSARASLRSARHRRRVAAETPTTGAGPRRRCPARRPAR